MRDENVIEKQYRKTLESRKEEVKENILFAFYSKHTPHQITVSGYKLSSRVHHDI